MKPIFTAFERNAALEVVNASETWSKGYEKSPDTLARMIKTGARLERKLLVFFRDIGKHNNNYIDWTAYQYALYSVNASQVKAYDVQVIVNDEAVEAEHQPFITITFDELALATAYGAQAGETIYSIPLGMDKADAEIQKLVRSQIADLVGKRIDEFGNLIDNPNAKYRISDKTRADIKAALQTSINLNEDVPTAAKRVEQVVGNAKRAALIAREETMSAYTNGLHEFGAQSGAIGKEWEDNGAVDICLTNSKKGPIPFKQKYPSGHSHPKAHIGCRCYERLIYQNELDDNPNLFKNA